jgi:hypothetical protein
MHAQTPRTVYGLTGWLSLMSVVLLSAGCVVAPPPQQPPVVHTPTPHPAYEEIRRCRADNQRAHADVLDSFDRARAAGRINPAEAQQFNAIDARLRNLRAQLARDGLTLQECQYLSGEIAQARNDVARMSYRDPALARCMADNRWAHQDVWNMYDNARRAGQIHPGETQRFNAMEARLQNFKNDLARDGISMQDCQRIGNAIASERNEVIRMSRYEPVASRCMADNRRAHWMVYEVYNDGVRTGRIDAAEAQRFRQVDERLRQHYAAVQRYGVTLDECQRLARAIAQERAMVDSMIRH